MNDLIVDWIITAVNINYKEWYGPYGCANSEDIYESYKRRYACKHNFLSVMGLRITVQNSFVFI